VFSVAQSRFALPAQAVFFMANAVGLFLGTVYNANTPDLYENNAHHKMGWIFTWFSGAWIVLGVLNIYATSYMKNRRHSGQQMSVANMTRYQRLQHEQQDTPERRWSRDSGQGTERNSDSLFGAGSPGTESEHRPFEEPIPLYSTNDFDDAASQAEKRGFLRNTRVDRYLSKNIHQLSSKFLSTSKVIYIIFERLLVVMGFVAILTGIATFGGLFVSTVLLQHDDDPLTDK
jgi:hypothetical protein